MKIVVMGDIHRHFEDLNTFINKEHPDIILQCGDNAYYWSKDNTGVIKPQNTKIYFVPGNHENWDTFEEKVGRNGSHPVEIEKNIFMCPIGSTIEVSGKTILFVGGANSIDKQYRIPKVTWWEQEVLDYIDFEYIEQNVKKVDVVISHTVPKYFNVGLQYTDKINDPTRDILNLVHDKYKPKLWMAGHWHEFLHGTYEETEWVVLNMINEPDWYTYLIL